MSRLTRLNKLINFFSSILKDYEKYQYITTVLALTPLLLFFVILNSDFKMVLLYLSFSSLIVLISIAGPADYVDSKQTGETYQNKFFVFFCLSSVVFPIWIGILHIAFYKSNINTDLFAKIILFKSILFSIYAVLKLSKFSFEDSIQGYLNDGREIFTKEQNKKNDRKKRKFVSDNKSILENTFKVKKFISFLVVFVILSLNFYFFYQNDTKLYIISSYQEFKIIEFEFSVRLIVFYIFWFVVLIGWYSAAFFLYKFFSLLTGTNLYAYTEGKRFK